MYWRWITGCWTCLWLKKAYCIDNRIEKYNGFTLVICMEVISRVHRWHYQQLHCKENIVITLNQSEYEYMDFHQSNWLFKGSSVIQSNRALHEKEGRVITTQNNHIKSRGVRWRVHIDSAKHLRGINNNIHPGGQSHFFGCKATDSWFCVANASH